MRIENRVRVRVRVRVGECAPALAASGDAPLAPARLDVLADAVRELRRERAAAHARRVRLRHAEHTAHHLSHAAYNKLTETKGRVY